MTRKTYYVDIPDVNCWRSSEGYWANVGTFDTREEALVFAQNCFGADEEGKIQLITESEIDEKEGQPLPDNRGACEGERMPTAELHEGGRLAWGSS